MIFEPGKISFIFCLTAVVDFVKVIMIKHRQAAVYMYILCIVLIVQSVYTLHPPESICTVIVRSHCSLLLDKNNGD